MFDTTRGLTSWSTSPGKLSFFARNIPDCEQSLFCSKIPAGGAARKRVRYSSRETRAASSVGGRVSEERKEIKGLQKCSMKAGQSLFSLFAHSPAHATRGSPLAARRSNIALVTLRHPARILEQKRDCSQSRNIHGVISKTLGNKLQSSDFLSMINGSDFIFLTETAPMLKLEGIDL